MTRNATHYAYVTCAITAVSLVAVFVCTQSASASEAHVSNTVSVTASGGTAHSSVKTTVNGQTVEDVQSDRPGTIVTHVDAVGGIVSSSSVSTNAATGTAAGSHSSTDTVLRERILTLISQINYYVSLLRQLQ